eukprot:1295095-Amorphochlora_amoeboformis.AAC.3
MVHKSKDCSYHANPSVIPQLRPPSQKWKRSSGTLTPDGKRRVSKTQNPDGIFPHISDPSYIDAGFLEWRLRRWFSAGTLNAWELLKSSSPLRKGCDPRHAPSKGRDPSFHERYFSVPRLCSTPWICDRKVWAAGIIS